MTVARSGHGRRGARTVGRRDPGAEHPLHRSIRRRQGHRRARRRSTSSAAAATPARCSTRGRSSSTSSRERRRSPGAAACSRRAASPRSSRRPRRPRAARDRLRAELPQLREVFLDIPRRRSARRGRASATTATKSPTPPTCRVPDLRPRRRRVDRPGGLVPRGAGRRAARPAAPVGAGHRESSVRSVSAVRLSRRWGRPHRRGSGSRRASALRGVGERDVEHAVDDETAAARSSRRRGPRRPRPRPG